MIGMVLLYFSLVPAFKSFIHPLTIMTAIPAGADRRHSGPCCWPDKQLSLTAAFMGMILLAGIVVKNSILLIDFIEMATGAGRCPRSTLSANSVRVRTRPILMTAFATAVGMVPIAMERAIGLERLSPLGRRRHRRAPGFHLFDPALRAHFLHAV